MLKKSVFFELYLVGLHEVLSLDPNIWMLKDIPVMPKIGPSQNASSATVETKGTAEINKAGGEVSQSSTQKEVQKEWTCALCLVTVRCEKTLISHLRGRRHRETMEALKAKKQPTLQKNLSEPIRMINSKIICKVCNIMLPSEDYVASHIKGWKHLSNIKS
jgi:hypothetical protein